MRIKDIVLISMMSAMLVCVQVALGFLPNIELVSLLIILFTIQYGKKTIYIIYVFVLLEGLIYGFHLWWINYLYVWDVLFIIALIFKKERSPVFWAVVSGMYGLSYGALCSIPYFFMGGFPTALAYWFNGIPFDIPHGIGNFIIALVLFTPLNRLLQFINSRRDPLQNPFD
ncbi:MAG: hypothetical protein K0S47_2707 [Herbinix sp.]|jgi:energy-coupling factor transport system substrate-specific component|nr:hypothetical protein [Herbinix sp.]